MSLCLKHLMSPYCSQDKRQIFLTWPGELCIICILLNFPNSSSLCSPLHSVLQELVFFWFSKYATCPPITGSLHMFLEWSFHLHSPYWLLCLLQIVICRHFLRRPILTLISRSNASIIDCCNTFFLCVIALIAATTICLWITWLMSLPSETILVYHCIVSYWNIIHRPLININWVNEQASESIMGGWGMRVEIKTNITKDFFFLPGIGVVKSL